MHGLARRRAEVLRQNAPKLYRQLKASGSLERHCEQAQENVLNAFRRARELGLNADMAKLDAEREFIYEIPEFDEAADE